MTEYALLVDNVFKEIRNYEEKPQNIPHKNITWHDVVRQYGSIAFEKLENDNWIIQKIDPQTLPQSIPFSVTPRQVRLLLLQKNMLADVENMISQQNEAVRITWEYATTFYRDDLLLNQLALNLNLTQDDLDQFFIEANKI